RLLVAGRGSRDLGHRDSLRGRLRRFEQRVKGPSRPGACQTPFASDRAQTVRYTTGMGGATWILPPKIVAADEGERAVIGADQQVDLPRTRPGTGPERAAAGLAEAAVEPEDAAQAIGERDRRAQVEGPRPGVDAEEALQVERDQVGTARPVPVGGGRADPRRE